MNHTIREFRTLRGYNTRRRLTPAGRFWAWYVVGIVLLAYAVVGAV
jgi:hypothetical protein